MNRKEKRAIKAKNGVKMESEDQLKQQYSQLCAKAGEMQYRLSQVKREYQSHIDNLSKDIAKVNKDLEGINIAFTQLLASKKQEASPVAAVSKEGVANESSSTAPQA